MMDGKVLLDGSPSSDVSYFLFYFENVEEVSATGEEKNKNPDFLPQRCGLLILL